MKNKHTPGPWYSNEKGIFAHNGGTLVSENLAVKWEALAVLQVNKKHIADIQKNIDSANANTKLMAAAPELLESLITLENVCRNALDISATNDGLKNCEILAKARFAISKAKGEA